MRLRLSLACVCLGPLLIVAGGSGCGPKASPDDCKKACERVAKLQLAPQRAKDMAALHEADELVESTEDGSKPNVARIKAEMERGDPQWDEKAVRARKLSPKALKAVMERHEESEKLLRRQQEAALKREAETLADVRAKYADLKKKQEAEMAGAVAAAVADCTTRCLTRTADDAHCLQRVQAVEDIEICDPKKK